MIRALILLTLVLPSSVVAQTQPVSRIAFGSCADQERPLPIFAKVLDAKPELLLMLGDNIYADTDDMQVMREKYGKLNALPAWRELKLRCPILATWDDHDYGKNDAGAEYPKKAEAQEAFLDFFEVPRDSPRRAQKGVYHAEIFGPPEKSVQVLLLDTRYFRSPLKKSTERLPNKGPYIPNEEPDATFLGEEQWKWLEEQLRKPARVRLLCSSIQVIAEEHGYECWMNIPAERAKLFKLLKETKATGVICLSGDRHLAELSVMDAGLGYPLFDLTASGFNQGSPVLREPEPNKYRLSLMNSGNHFGLVTIDWANKDPLIALSILDEDGDVRIKQKLRLSQLAPPGGAALALNGALTPEEAIQKVGEEVTVQFVVQGGTFIKSNMFTLLNSEKDYKSEKNITVLIEKNVLAEKFQNAEARSFFTKVVRATGKVTLFQNRPQIRISDPSKIEVFE